MPVAVRLQDIVEALQLQAEDSVSYLNPETGEIVMVTEEDRELVEEDEGEDEKLPAWQRESLARVREALDSEKYLPLPTQYDIHEWAIMDEFARSREVEDEREQLLSAIRGKGAFRRFERAIRDLGIEAAWHGFRQASIEAIGREWLEAHGIPYE